MDFYLLLPKLELKYFGIRKVRRFRWPTREAINQMTDNTQGELSKEK
jgi:hypothetical protein